MHSKDHQIRLPVRTGHLGRLTTQLLHWHACRQRLDRRRAEPAWRHSLRMFVDQTGRPYTETNADEAVTIAAARAGLPPITFARLRDLAASR